MSNGHDGYELVLEGVGGHPVIWVADRSDNREELLAEAEEANARLDHTSWLEYRVQAEHAVPAQEEYGID